MEQMETVETSGLTDMYADDARPIPTQQEQPFYKSQKEVDRAFAMRLAAERKKWEAERAEEDAHTPPAAPMETQQAEQASPADEPSPLASTGETEPDAAAQEQEGSLPYETERAFLRRIQQGEQKVLAIDPDFDLGQEMARNPMFGLMLAQGVEVERAYAFFHPETAEARLRKRVEAEVLERLRMRNNRPEALRAGNSSAVHRDVSRMSEADLMRIDERVKRGERVVL